MNIYDCFMYFDEDLILDIRLNILDKYVDKFIIAEATIDHAGKEKKINFNINKFSKFKHKIKHLIVDNVPRDVKFYKKNWNSAHIRDQFQRNSLIKGLQELNENDWVMISDIDEIPDPKKINLFNPKNKYACFVQKNFQAKLNQLNISEPLWPGTKICVKKYLKSPQWLRNIKIKNVPFWKFYKPKKPQIINEGGWHFSFLKTPENISNKIKSFAHQEYNKKKYSDVESIKRRISLGKDLFDRNLSYKNIKIDNSFPEYIQKNKIKLSDWII